MKTPALSVLSPGDPDQLRVPGVRPAGLHGLDSIANHVPGVLLVTPLLYWLWEGWPGCWLLAWGVFIAGPALIVHQLRKRIDGWIAIDARERALVEVIHGPFGTRERVLARIASLARVEQIVWLQEREGMAAVVEEHRPERSPMECTLWVHPVDGTKPLLIGTVLPTGSDRPAWEVLQAALQLPAATVHRRKAMRVAAMEAVMALLTGALYTWPAGFGALLMMPRAHRILADSAQDNGGLAENDPRAFMIGILAPIVGLAAWLLLVPFVPEFVSPKSIHLVMGTMAGSLLANVAFQALSCHFLRRRVKRKAMSTLAAPVVTCVGRAG